MNKLKIYMNSIPVGEYASVRYIIVKECHISIDVWRNWLSGRTAIPPLAKPIINKIAGYDIFCTETISEENNSSN